MSALAPYARRRSLKLRLDYIEEKIVRVQGELSTVEQEIAISTPGLFPDNHIGVSALKSQLEHLERVAMEIREELGQKPGR